MFIYSAKVVSFDPKIVFIIHAFHGTFPLFILSGHKL